MRGLEDRVALWGCRVAGGHDFLSEHYNEVC